MTNARMLAGILWVCTAAASLGIALNMFPEYRNALGVVRSSVDLFITNGPGILCAALHALCALRVRSRRSPNERAVLACGTFDIVVGALMLIPWAGLWVALLSPFRFVTILGFYVPRISSVAYYATGIATVVVGIWIVMRSVAMDSARQTRSASR
jgi:hypothetical protein